MDRMAGSTPLSGSTKARRTVASFGSYADAQKAVDYLSDQKFAVEKTAIVGEGLKLVEQVTGRLNWGRVISTSASSGALTGVLLGLLLGILFNIPLLNIVLYGLVVGIISSILFGALAYGMTGGRRDFSSVGGMQADRYNVMVDEDAADEAEGLLRAMS